VEPLNVAKQIVAYHESGHALLAYLLPKADALEKATVIPRGHALAVTAQVPEEERYNFGESYLRDKIAVMFGRASGRISGIQRGSRSGDTGKTPRSIRNPCPGPGGTGNPGGGSNPRDPEGSGDGRAGVTLFRRGLDYTRHENPCMEEAP